MERKLEAAAQRAHPRGTGVGQRFPPPPAIKRLNGRLLSLVPPASPRQGRAPGRGRGQAPHTPAPPPSPRCLGERRSDALGPRRTLSAFLSPACARALAQVPRSLTQCRRLRRAQRPGRRNSSGAGGGGGGGVARQGEGKSARESGRQRETRGGRKRACAPPPASGEAEPQQ